MIDRKFKINICHVSSAPIRKEYSDASEIVTQILFGETVHIIEQKNQWVKIQTSWDQYEGWMDSKQLMPCSTDQLKELVRLTSSSATIIRPDGSNQLILKGSFCKKGKFQFGNFTFQCNEEIETNKSDLASICNEYLNAPYLWGGRSLVGIDCSGLTQIVFSFLDISLKRDASQQEKQGESIEYGEHQEGDLAFFSNEKGNVIHVGIVLNNNQIVHAAGRVKIDSLTKNGILSNEQITHELSSIKRITN